MLFKLHDSQVNIDVGLAFQSVTNKEKGNVVPHRLSLKKGRFAMTDV